MIVDKTKDLVIYKARNKINGILYIGLTTLGFKTRYRTHRNASKNVKYSNYNTHFYRAIRKYGWENFEWDVIDSAETSEELKDKEMYWILFYDSYKNGYNSTLGGDLNKGRIVSEAIRQRLREVKTGVPVHTEESRKLLSLATKGINNPRCQKIVKLTKEGEFIDEYEFISDALESIVQVDISHIVKCCKGKLKMAYGFKWMYEEDYKKYSSGESEVEVSQKYRTIIQLTVGGIFVSEHQTLKDGADYIGGNRHGIGKCCRGQQGSYKGFKWIYKDEYLKMIS